MSDHNSQVTIVVKVITDRLTDMIKYFIFPVSYYYVVPVHVPVW